MSNRRDFLKQASLLMAGSFLGVQNVEAAITKGKKQIGIQLYSVREAMKDDVKTTLKKLSKIGYYNLEAAGYSNGKLYGMPPKEFKEMVTDFGMKLTGSHLGKGYDKQNYAQITSWWQEAIDAHNEAGVKFMVQPSPPIMLKGCTEQQLEECCNYLNDVGVMCNASGIRFGFHNHKEEFLKLPNGDVIYDFMIKNTDPTRVMFEMDTYWITMAGYSAVEYLNNYPDRFELLHIKDEKEIGASGKMDFKVIFDTAKSFGKVKEYYIEQEAYTSEPLVSVKESFQYINKGFFEI